MADDISIRIALRNAAKFAADVRMERREIRGLGDDTAKAGRKAKKATVEYTIFGAALRQAKIAGTVAGLGLLVHMLVAGGLATVGFVAALVPMLGALGAIPALGALAGQGLGVALLALKGVKEALGGLNESIDPEKFAALGRPAQDLVLLLDALRPRVRSLQAAVGKGLFPGLTAGLLAAAPALDALKGPLTGTGAVLGLFALHLGQLVGSQGFLSDLSSQARFNNVQLGRLGGAGIHVVNMLRNLMVGSRGLVSWLVKLTAGWAATGDRMTAAGRKSGGLQQGFHTVQVTLSRVGRLLWRLGVGLWNIGRIGKKQIGDGILVYLLKGATAFERWTSSAEGVSQITSTFAKARGVLRQVADTLDRFRSTVSPDLVAGLRNITEAFAPLLASGGAVTVLSLYVNFLSDLASVIGWLANNVPGASWVMSAFIGLFLLSKIAGVMYMAQALKLLGKAVLVTAAQTAFGYRAFWALNAALVAVRAAAATTWLALLGPVGLAILGIAAVAAAFYLLYTRVGWFHNAVDDVFDFLVNHWGLLGRIIAGPIGLAVGLIIEGVRLVKSVVGGIIDWIGQKIQGVLGLPGKIKDGVLGLPGKVLGKARSILPFAGGGLVNSPFQLVGERGPELAALPMGSRVFTAPQTATMLRAPRMQKVRHAGGEGGDGGGQPIHLRSEITLKVGERVLAQIVNDEVARQHGRSR